jgi:hypothetical protein
MEEYSRIKTIIERIEDLKIVKNLDEKTRQRLIAQALVLASGIIKKQFNYKYLTSQDSEIYTREMLEISNILEAIANDVKGTTWGFEGVSKQLEMRIELLKDSYSKNTKLPTGKIYGLTRLILLKNNENKNEKYRKIGESIEKMLYGPYNNSFYRPFRNKLNQIPTNNKKVRKSKDKDNQKRGELKKQQLLVEERFIRDSLRKLL